MQPLQDISAHLPPAMMVIFRIGGLTIFGPVLGSKIVPVRMKVMLSFIIGVAVYPMLSSAALVGMPAEMNLFQLAPMIILELLIGLAIGYAASMPLTAMQTGGLIMGQQMGLGFARFFNPAIDDEADVLGQVLFFMALATFLVIGGHEYMLLAVLRSFEHVPLGGFTLDVSLVDLILGLLMASFEFAMRVAMPLLAIVFIESVAMGFISKTVPQLNILSLGFPIRILAGFAIVAFGLAVMHDILLDEFNDTLTTIFDWIESLGATS
ncbi:MAG: flagellar biosynthetic protein FliR [Planctomycetota bacterium]|nr:flagellar biosynthetic protein FliR [Planctomycetota bacterium]